MAGSINFGESRGAIHNYAVGADAAWEAKQHNLVMALDNVINLGRDGVSGERFGFSANSENDEKKVLGLLAGYLRYKGFSDEDIFAPVGGGSRLAEFQRQGSIVDKRSETITEFCQIFTGRMAGEKAKALIAIAKSMGDYPVEMPDISQEMDSRQFSSYVDRARINGLVADSVSAMFFSPEQYNESPNEIHFNETIMNNVWRRLHVDDIEAFNKSADYARIHRSMAAVAEGFNEIAKSEHFADEEAIADEGLAKSKNVAAALNYVDKFGEYNMTDVAMENTDGRYNSSAKCSAKSLAPEFVSEFDIDEASVENNADELNTAFKGNDAQGVSKGKHREMFRQTESFAPYLLESDNITLFNTLLGTEHRHEYSIEAELRKVNVGDMNLAGKKIAEAARLVRESFNKGETVSVMEGELEYVDLNNAARTKETKEARKDLQNRSYSQIRILNVDTERHSKVSKTGKTDEANRLKTQAKVYFNSLLGTEDLDTRDLKKKLENVRIDGSNEWLPKRGDIVTVFNAFKRNIAPKTTGNSIEEYIEAPRPVVTVLNSQNINERVIVEFPDYTPSSRKFLNTILGTELTSNKELEDEINRIRVGGRNLPELLDPEKDKMDEAVRILKEAYRDKTEIEILPEMKARFKVFKADFKTTDEHKWIDLKSPETAKKETGRSRHHTSKPAPESEQKTPEAEETNEEEHKHRKRRSKHRTRLSDFDTKPVRHGRNTFEAEENIIALSNRDDTEKIFKTITGVDAARIGNPDHPLNKKVEGDMASFLYGNTKRAEEFRAELNRISGTPNEHFEFTNELAAEYIGSIYINGKSALELHAGDAKNADGIVNN